MAKPGPKILLLFLLLALCVYRVQAQTTHYKQFWNEFAFTKPLKGKWSLEAHLGQSYTATPPENKSMFASVAQRYARFWIHYYHNAKWKFSMYGGYYYNRYVPEIDQREYDETRFALQATWFLVRTRLSLLSKFRFEDRHIENTDGYNEGLYRFSNQWKVMYPFNGKRIRAGIVFGLVSDDVFFKTASNVAGSQFFDRNMLTAGVGYSITDDIQIEVNYVNEYVPRPSVSEMYHALQINVSFNNLVPGITKIFKKEKDEPVVN